MYVCQYGRLFSAGLGPVVATVDLDAVEAGTRIHLRWKYAGDGSVDADCVERIRIEKEAAFGRLASVVAGALPGAGVDRWQSSR